MSAKQYLLGLAIVAVLLWVLGNVVWGPPGLSQAYLEGVIDAETGEVLQPPKKAEHDHYLNIIKSDTYKLYAQRPWLHEGAVHPDDLQFVKDYEHNARFKKEQTRRFYYELYFDFVRVGLFLALVLHFARKPLLKFLDEKIAELRQRVEAAAQAREEAGKRKAEAEAKLAALPEEEARLERETRFRLDRELAELDEANRHSIEVMEREMADRVNAQEHAAAELVKRELVNEAIEALKREYKAEASPAQQHALIDRFTDELEKLA